MFNFQPVHREPFTSDRKIMTTVVSLTPLPSEQQHDVQKNATSAAKAAVDAAVATPLLGMGRRRSTGTPAKVERSSGSVHQRSNRERRTSAPVGIRHVSIPKGHLGSDETSSSLGVKNRQPEHLLKECENFENLVPSRGDSGENQCFARDDDTVVYRVFVKGAAERVLQLCSYYISSVPPHQAFLTKPSESKYTDLDSTLDEPYYCTSVQKNGIQIIRHQTPVSQRETTLSGQEYNCSISETVEDSYVTGTCTDTPPDLYTRPLDASSHAAIEKQVIDVMAGQALRTICIAYKDIVCKRSDKTWRELSDIKGYKRMELGLTCLAIVGIR